jgi:hypothetical protein
MDKIHLVRWLLGDAIPDWHMPTGNSLIPGWYMPAGNNN